MLALDGRPRGLALAVSLDALCHLENETEKRRDGRWSGMYPRKLHHVYMMGSDAEKIHQTFYK